MSTGEPAAVDAKCPACGSANLRQVPLLWKEISSGVYPSGEVVAAALVGTEIGGRAARTLSEEEKRELLAHELGPPKKLADPPAVGACRDMLARVVLFLGGLVLVILACLRLVAAYPRTGRILTTVIGGLVTAAVLYLLARVVAPRPTFREYESRVIAWEHMFLCVECGNRFCQDV